MKLLHIGWSLAAALVLTTTAAFAPQAQAQIENLPKPIDETVAVTARDALPVFVVPDIDQHVVDQLEAQDAAQGLAPRYAISFDVDITPDTHGTWEQVSESMIVWRLRVR